MKIKSLDIVGFKSFPNRTRVAFPEGISAIVGPNGCGKSNIVDAIRWVMGEQSARQLRGRNMDDVLFNGAGGDKPAALAEVALTMSNENGFDAKKALGPSEISITRRLFRSGDSEYLINNVPCRLKDVAQFFMDTGLGTRAYSIIEQGRIGALVDSRPEERRNLIDEAAGITRYKVQAREARRKLESTEQNLVHIKTLMGETNRQLAAIVRAAKKAAEYKSMKAELKGIDLSLARQTLEGLNQATARLGARKAGQEARLMETISALEAKELDIQERKLAILEHEKLTEARADTFYKLKNEYSTLLKEHEFLLGQERASVERAGRLDQEIAGLEGQLGEKAAESELAVREQAALSRELTEKKERLTHSDQGYEAAVQEHKSRLAARDALARELAAAENQAARLEEKGASLESRLAGMGNRHAELEAEAREAQTQTQDLESKKNALEAEALDREKALAELTSRLQDHRRRLAGLAENRKALDRRERAAESELAGLTGRLATLKDVQANYGWYPETVRALMKKGRAAGLELLGPVGDHVEAPSGFEPALAAALGPGINHVLAPHGRAVVQAIEFLDAHGLGQAGFIALDQVPGGLAGLLSHLLGPFELAESLEKGLERWPGQTVLTRCGCFLGCQGLIVGGRAAAKNPSVLSRKKEIEGLAAQVERRQAEKQALTQELALLGEETGKMEAVAGGLEKEAAALKNSLAETRRAIAGLDIRAQEARRRTAGLARSLERHGAEEAELSAALVSARQEASEVKRQAGETAGRLETANQGLDALAENLAAQATARQEARLKLNTLTHRLEALARDQARLAQWLEETRQRIEKKQGEKLRAGQEEAQLGQRAAKIKQTLGGFDDRLEEAERQMRASRSFVDELRARLGELEAVVRGLRKKREEAGAGLNELDLGLQEAALKRQSLLGRVMDDYSLDLTELPPEFAAGLPAGLDAQTAEDRKAQLKKKIEAMGEVNLAAISEEAALKERSDFYGRQYDDLTASIKNLRESMDRINRTCRIRFMRTFKAVDEKLREIFPILFEGGEAWLSLTDESDPLESGVEIHVHPPGKRLTVMSLLSGGEKALVALALIFSLYLIKPSPFCLLDETDAPLDEANIDRFNRLLGRLGQSSQIILITHNKRTMQIADTLYGVTMESPGVSKMVSVRLGEVADKEENEISEAS